MPTAPGHPNEHFWLTLVLIGVSVALMAMVRNRVIRRRLFFTLVLLVASAALHLVILERPDLDGMTPTGLQIERLLVVIALVNALISLLFNPWFKDQISDRAPAIVQDAIFVLLATVSAVLVFNVSSFNFLASSAIAAAIIGFALQETLANAFAGIAIQIEKPFRVGHWITVGSYEGLVTEVTWRATKLRTKAGNLVIVPNSTIAKESINNYSEPTAPTRLYVEVGCAYQTPPNEIRDALLRAVSQTRIALTSPMPDVLLQEFAGSAITYRVRFWIEDFSRDEEARTAVRTAIYYELRRRNIEIPWPIQIQYEREEPPLDSLERRADFKRAIANVAMLAKLPDDAHQALANAASEMLFADGEVIVREGDPGGSMFIVVRGKVAIAVGAERREVAVTEAGGYFGEMSLLTGDPRTATVIARGDSVVLEISADAFRHYVQSRPEVIEPLATAAAARRKELDHSRGTGAAAVAATPISLAERMRRFFGLS